MYKYDDLTIYLPWKWGPMAACNYLSTLDMCTRYPLQLGDPRQHGIAKFSATSTNDQRKKLNPRHLDLEFTIQT